MRLFAAQTPTMELHKLFIAESSVRFNLSKMPLLLEYRVLNYLLMVISIADLVIGFSQALPMEKR